MKLKHFFPIGLLFLASVPRIEAESVITEVTPDNLVSGALSFEVHAGSKPNGDTDFHILVTDDEGKPASRTDLSLSLVEVEETRQSITNVRKLANDRKRNTTTTEFTVNKADFEDPRLCLTFTKYVDVRIGGKITPMPSADIYIIRLHKFVAGETKTVVCESPDGAALLAWSDIDAGEPIGLIRPIVFRLAGDAYSYFSVVSSPRSTQGAWNTASTLCALADAPDNAGPRFWLIERHAEEPQWRSIEIEPFASIEEEFSRSDHGSTLFRPSVLKMQWTSEFILAIRGYCSLGTYLITVDAREPFERPNVQRLSEKLLEE